MFYPKFPKPKPYLGFRFIDLKETEQPKQDTKKTESCEHCKTSTCILKRFELMESELVVWKSRVVAAESECKKVEKRCQILEEQALKQCRALEQRCQILEEQAQKQQGKLLTVAEDDYFQHASYPINKRPQKDMQGQLRMMTPPGSMSSISSVPSP
jgi:hypothetical protein